MEIKLAKLYSLVQVFVFKNVIRFDYNIILKFSKALLSTYKIPTSISTVTTNPGSYYLLLNSEFHNDTYLSGFEFYAVSSGTINIQV